MSSVSRIELYQFLFDSRFVLHHLGFSPIINGFIFCFSVLLCKVEVTRCLGKLCFEQ